MAFRILVTEGASPIGAALLNGFEEHPFSIICPEPGHVDWCDEQSVRSLIQKARPAIVINTLNWLATANGLQESPPCLPGALAELSKTDDLTVIHLSSHHVFSEKEQKGILKEGDEPDSDTSLAQMLMAAERAYSEVPRCLIMRLPWIVDAPNGMIDQVCGALIKGHLSVSDSWKGAPVNCERVVSAIIAIIQQILCGAENWGVFHLHASDQCSEAEFADFASRNLQKFGIQVGNISIVSEVDRLMTSNGLLGGRKITDNFGIQLLSWRIGAKSLIRKWVDKRIAAGEIEVKPVLEEQSGEA